MPTHDEYIKNKNYYLTYAKKTAYKFKKYREQFGKSYRWELRQIALFIYSNGEMKCNKCGFEDIDCLDIDHINNDGNRSGHLYQELQTMKYPNKFQVLCRNCNWKKRLENIEAT